VTRREDILRLYAACQLHHFIRSFGKGSRTEWTLKTSLLFRLKQTNREFTSC
jgi:hypothetical protein